MYQGTMNMKFVYLMKGRTSRRFRDLTAQVSYYLKYILLLRSTFS